MAQDLLENTNSYLLNVTAPDSSAYAKNATKNYTETFNKNGQSFNDIKILLINLRQEIQTKIMLEI